MKNDNLEEHLISDEECYLACPGRLAIGSTASGLSLCKKKKKKDDTCLAQMSFSFLKEITNTEVV